MTSAAASRLPQHVSATQAVMIVALCAALNVFGGFAAKTLSIPFLYLDTVGTFVAAVLLGPWWAAAAGASYNVVANFTFDPTTWPFAMVSVIVGLMWGYGLRRFGLGRSAWSFLGLGLVIAVVSSVVASAVVLFFFAGATGSASDAITLILELTGMNLGLSVFFSNLISNAADKLIAASLGLALVRALPGTYLAGVRLPSQSRFGLLGTTAVGIAVGLGFGVVALLWPKAA